MKNFSVARGKKGQCLSQQFNPSQVCCHQNSYRGEFTANTAGFGLYVQAGCIREYVQMNKLSTKLLW